MEGGEKEGGREEGREGRNSSQSTMNYTFLALMCQE